MRTLILIYITAILTWSTFAKAQNFMRYEDVEAGLVRGFQLESDCTKENKLCFNADSTPDLDTKSSRPIQVDDLDKPIYSAASNITVCQGHNECYALLPTLCTSPALPFYRMTSMTAFEAYCATITGYEQKQVYELFVDSNKVSQKATKNAQRLAALTRQESVEALSLGEDIIVDIRVLNRTKIASGSLNFQSLMASQDVANIERLLRSGSLETAKALIQSIQGFYTTQEKAAIISRIDAHFAKWAP